MTTQSIIELTSLSIAIIGGGVSIGMIKQKVNSLDKCRDCILDNLEKVWLEINNNKVSDMKVITKLETIEVEIQQLRAENNDRAEQQNKITESLISMINNNIGAKNA